MAFRCKHQLTIDVQASGASQVEYTSVVRASFDLNLTWDSSGRQLWACEGWRLEGRDHFVSWDDTGHPLTQAMHALLSSHLTPQVISAMIEQHHDAVGNVIDLAVQRKLRGLKPVSADRATPTGLGVEQSV